MIWQHKLNLLRKLNLSNSMDKPHINLDNKFLIPRLLREIFYFKKPEKRNKTGAQASGKRPDHWVKTWWNTRVVCVMSVCTLHKIFKSFCTQMTVNVHFKLKKNFQKERYMRYKVSAITLKTYKYLENETRYSDKLKTPFRLIWKCSAAFKFEPAIFRCNRTLMFKQQRFKCCQ